ncbi:Zinc-binding dehydrogenase-like protein 24 [Elsinoe fawcettii]|nr:Zinc-binding dehydrogenase-like protein 24 [Elsinoe fawcettii]
MRAIGVQKYGAVNELKALNLPNPKLESDDDILVRVRAASINPVDTKTRAGTYDDYCYGSNPLEYYKHAPRLPHIIGFDGAGVVEATGKNASQRFKTGDEVYYCSSPFRQGTNAELQLVDYRSVAKKPKNLDFTEAAALPLTWITAWEALVERIEIKKGENAALLIINGAGGVGSAASQIARKVLNLPTIITTASRDETKQFTTEMGATHVINHREDVVKQIKDLKLQQPLKYIFITSRTEQYLSQCADVAAPFGKVCSIVQTKDLSGMYGHEWMAKSLTFVWELLGTKPYYGVDVDSHGKILEDLRKWIEEGTIKTTLKTRLPLTVAGLWKGHELLESGKGIGKTGFEVAYDGMVESDAFR